MLSTFLNVSSFLIRHTSSMPLMLLLTRRVKDIKNHSVTQARFIASASLLKCLQARRTLIYQTPVQPSLDNSSFVVKLERSEGGLPHVLEGSHKIEVSFFFNP